MATITLTGTANGVVLYTATAGHTMYVPKPMLSHFCPVNSDVIKVGCGAYQMEWKFDSESQRNAAITTLLTYF